MSPEQIRKALEQGEHADAIGRSLGVCGRTIRRRAASVGWTPGPRVRTGRYNRVIVMVDDKTMRALRKWAKRCKVIPARAASAILDEYLVSR